MFTLKIVQLKITSSCVSVSWTALLCICFDTAGTQTLFGFAYVVLHSGCHNQWRGLQPSNLITGSASS
jgi:hypothetical protein